MISIALSILAAFPLDMTSLPRANSVFASLAYAFEPVVNVNFA
ncbi:MAG: hypothetical protein VB142_10170 [Burkholderia sp.]